MNNSKIWLVVSPNVGLPLFLSAVAIGSFAVHLAVVSNTDWIEQFHSGEQMTAIEAPAGQATANVALDGAATLANGQEMAVTLPDGRVATLVVREPTPQTAMTAPMNAPAIE